MLALLGSSVWSVWYDIKGLQHQMLQHRLDCSSLHLLPAMIRDSSVMRMLAAPDYP